MKKMDVAIKGTASITAVLFGICMLMCLIVVLNSIGTPFLVEQQLSSIQYWLCEVFRVAMISFVILAVLLVFGL